MISVLVSDGEDVQCTFPASPLWLILMRIRWRMNYWRVSHINKPGCIDIVLNGVEELFLHRCLYRTENAFPQEDLELGTHQPLTNTEKFFLVCLNQITVLI